MNIEAKGEMRYGQTPATALDPKTVKIFAKRSVSNYVEAARGDGYTGLEWWELRPRLQAALVSDEIPEEDKPFIISAHQTVSRRPQDMRTTRDVLVGVTQPEKKRSLEGLKKLGEAVGDIPVVLFEGTTHIDHDELGFTSRNIQPHARFMKPWNAKNGEQLVQRVHEYGFTGIVYDDHHTRSAHPDTKEPSFLADWETLIPQIADHVAEIHIGVARLDYGDRDKTQVIDEARDLLFGGRRATDLIKILRLFKEHGWKGLIVPELRPSIIAKHVFGDNSLFITEAKLREMHVRILDTLKNIFEK